MSVPVGYELLGSVINPLGFQLSGDVQYNNFNLKKALVNPVIPVFEIDNQFMNHYQQD